MIMNNWFTCKVKIEVLTEGGMLKPQTDTYLVDALNFTEAETRVLKEVTPFTQGGIDVTDIKRAKFAEMFTDSSENADKWYRVKCKFITIDEKTEKEKETAQNMLVQAASFHDAVKNFDNGMKGSMMDYKIAAVTETNILDVFPYDASKEPEDKPEYEQ